MKKQLRQLTKMILLVVELHLLHFIEFQTYGIRLSRWSYFYILKATGYDGKEYNQQNYINLFI